MIVPARDEAAALPALLEALRGQHQPPAEVIVVDDGSRDATAVVSRRHGAQVIDPGEPPQGWTGKAWACAVGADRARGDLLLFLDADTRLAAPGALAGLVEVHQEHGGLVSVQPHHEVPRTVENLSACFNLVALLAGGAFTGGPGRARVAYGPCLLVSRDDHRRVGGHASVRGSVLDDIDLAAAYRASGLAVTCLVGGRSLRMRSYPRGWRALSSGWEKNIAAGSGAAPSWSVAATVLWLAVQHLVAGGAVVSGARAARHVRGGQTRGRGTIGGSAAPDVVWALGWVVLARQQRQALRHAGSFRWWTWAAFPVPLLAFDLVFARSMCRSLVHGSVDWRGRTVDLTRSGRAGRTSG